MLVLRWINEKTENIFREFSELRYGKHKGNEKRAFTDLMNFISSEIGQESFQKWLINESQKNPIELQ